jgi:hypothetical protein
MSYSGMLRRVALVITDVSEKLLASIFRVTRIGEMGRTLAVTSNLRRQKTLRSVRRLLVTTSVVSSPPILVTRRWRRSVPLKRQFLQESHDITSQKTTFIIVTAVKTSNLAYLRQIAAHVLSVQKFKWKQWRRARIEMIRAMHLAVSAV